MGRIQEVAQRQGIPIEDKSVGADLVVEMLCNKGVVVGRDAIYNVRSGRKTGNRIGWKLEALETLQGTASRKDSLYYEMADAGVLARETNQRGHYSPVNFSKAIAQELDITEPNINRCLRAMRAEMVLSHTEDDGPNVIEAFRDAAREYISHYDRGYSSSGAVRDIASMWREGSMDDFYRACAIALPYPYSLRTWMPYEADVLQEFYRQRIRNANPLSSLDQLTLNKNISRSPLSSLISHVRAQSGIPYDEVTHYSHTNALLYGVPTRPLENGNVPIS